MTPPRSKDRTTCQEASPTSQASKEEQHRSFDTLALRHYWGFKWLDATHLNSFWIGAGYFLVIMLILFSIESTQQLVQVQPVLKWVVSSISAGFLTIWLVLSGGAQKDYADICSYSRTPLPSDVQAFVQSTRWVRILEWLGGCLLGFIISVSGRAITQNQSLLSAITAPFVEYGFGFGVGFYSTCITLVFMISGICMVRVVTFLYRQIRLFREAARTISLDLLNPEPLAAFANQSLRTFLGLVGLAATIPLTLSASDEISRTFIPIGLPMMAVMLVLLVLVSRPLWILRGRLKAEKRTELALISRALNGERRALASSRISAHQEEFHMPELLYYEDRIRSVWEWPLHAHVRRIALYVILPPLAWVLAAIVELFVDTALQ